MKFKTAITKPWLWVMITTLTANFIKSAPITYMSGIFLQYQFRGWGIFYFYTLSNTHRKLEDV